jgi:hypothetical protein
MCFQGWFYDLINKQIKKNKKLLAHSWSIDWIGWEINIINYYFYVDLLLSQTK